MDLLSKIIKATISEPNDMELGGIVRQLVNKWEHDEAKLGYEDAKIYESPDGGKTVYERPFGSDVSERKLVTNQLNIFDEIN